jgi:hypothetical protein
LHIYHSYFFFFPFFFFTPPPIGLPAAGATLDPAEVAPPTPAMLDVSSGAAGWGPAGGGGDAAFLFCILRIRDRFNVSKRFKKIDE